MFKPFLIAAALATAALVAPPASASQDALRELEEQIPGTLVNDPSRLDWESYGDIERNAIIDEAIPGGGAAIRFDVKRANEFIYTAGTNVPLTKSVRRGETVTIGFYARTVEAQTDDGNGVVRVRFQQNAEPYPGFGEQTLSIGQDWDWYEVTAEAEMALRRKDGIVALQFGRTRQVIEIGQTIVVSGADRIASDAQVARPQPASEPQSTSQPTPVPNGREEPLIPEPLEGVGELLNDPTGADWRVIGDAESATARDEPAIWLNRATRFTVSSPSDERDALSLAIPLNISIGAADNLLIAVAGRTERAVASGQLAIVDAWIDDLEPGKSDFATAQFPLGEDWQLIRLRARSPRTLPPGSAELRLSFTSAVQEVDIGPVYVFRTEPTD